jgi:hypothetical protein
LARLGFPRRRRHRACSRWARPTPQCRAGATRTTHASGLLDRASRRRCVWSRLGCRRATGNWPHPRRIEERKDQRRRASSDLDPRSPNERDRRGSEHHRPSDRRSRSSGAAGGVGRTRDVEGPESGGRSSADEGQDRARSPVGALTFLTHPDPRFDRSSKKKGKNKKQVDLGPALSFADAVALVGRFAFDDGRSRDDIQAQMKASLRALRSRATAEVLQKLLLGHFFEVAQASGVISARELSAGLPLVDVILHLEPDWVQIQPGLKMIVGAEQIAVSCVG